MRMAKVGNRDMPAAHQIIENARVNDVAEYHARRSKIKNSSKVLRTLVTFSQIKGSRSILVSYLL